MNPSERLHSKSIVKSKSFINSSKASKCDKRRRPKPDSKTLNLNLLSSNNHWKICESNNHLKVSPTALENLSKEAQEKINLEKYCKYLNLVPKWILEKQTKDELYRNWPLRLISKKNYTSSVSIFTNLRSDYEHSQKLFQFNPVLNRITKNGRILNEFNSNLNRQLKCKIYFKNIANRPSSSHLIDCLADLKVKSNQYHHRVSGYSPHWTLYSKFSQLNALCFNSFNESQLRSLREMKKILSTRLCELEFSSPLGKRLLKIFSDAIRFESRTVSLFDHEKYCSTDSRIFHFFYKPSSYSSSSKFKPLRTLRSNTFIEEKPYSNSNPRTYTHTYCFNRKQRYSKWNKIDSSLNFDTYSYPFDTEINSTISSNRLHFSSSSNNIASNSLVGRFRDKSRLTHPLSSLTNLNSNHKSVSTLQSKVRFIPVKNNLETFTTKPFTNCGYDIVFTPIEDTKTQVTSSSTKLNSNGISKLDLDGQSNEGVSKVSSSDSGSKLTSDVILNSNSKLLSDISSRLDKSEDCKLVRVKSPQEVKCSKATSAACDVKIESASKPNERLLIIRTHKMESEESRNRRKKLELFDDVVRIIKVNPRTPRKRQFSLDREEVSWAYVDKAKKRKV